MATSHAGTSAHALKASESQSDDAANIGDFSTFEAAEIYAASMGRRLTKKGWKAQCICHYCREKGHIKPECPKWLRLSEEERRVWNEKNGRGPADRSRHQLPTMRREHGRPPPSSASTRRRRILSAIEEHDPELAEELHSADDYLSRALTVEGCDEADVGDALSTSKG